MTIFYHELMVSHRVCERSLLRFMKYFFTGLVFSALVEGDCLSVFVDILYICAG